MVTVKQITVDELRDMGAQGGLVFHNCPISPYELASLLNEAFTCAGILRDGNEFKAVMTFRHNGADNVVFPFENIDLEHVKLVAWQVMTYDTCHGLFLSDFIRYELDGAKVPDVLARRASEAEKCTSPGHKGAVEPPFPTVQDKKSKKKERHSHER